MKEHNCGEAEARERLKQRIRIEVAKYVQTVKDSKTRTDLSDESKRYIDVMQYTLSGNAAWSTQCPRYHADAKWNELQLLRAKYGVEKYPAQWPPKDATDGLSTKTGHKEPHINGNGVGHSEAPKANGHKRKRNGESNGDDRRANGTNGVKKSALSAASSIDSLDLDDVVSLAVDSDLPDLSEDVS